MASASEIQWGSPARAAESLVSTLFTLCILFNSLSFISVLLRLYTRKSILGILGADDITIVLAIILSFGVTICTLYQSAHGGLGRHVEFSTPEMFVVSSKCLYASVLLYNAAQIVTKISFLIQYKRLFPGKNMQIVCIGALGGAAIWGVLQQFISAWSCSPMGRPAPPWQTKCLPAAHVFNANSAMNIITDFLVILIPIAPVLRLQMPLRRKMNLLIVFCLGFFACAISIVRMHEYHRIAHSVDPLWDGVPTSYWSFIELNVGILCACLPTLRPLVKKYIPALLGSSYDQSMPYGASIPLSQRISTLQSKHRKMDMESGIYVQEEMEITSTTELRSLGDVGHKVQITSEVKEARG